MEKLPPEKSATGEVNEEGSHNQPRKFKDLARRLLKVSRAELEMKEKDYLRQKRGE
jgi:hypothetical protein